MLQRFEAQGETGPTGQRDRQDQPACLTRAQPIHKLYYRSSAVKRPEQTWLWSSLMKVMRKTNDMEMILFMGLIVKIEEGCLVRHQQAGAVQHALCLGCWLEGHGVDDGSQRLIDFFVCFVLTTVTCE